MRAKKKHTKMLPVINGCGQIKAFMTLSNKKTKKLNGKGLFEDLGLHRNGASN